MAAEVFLGGSCGPTRWRQEFAIPLLSQNKISFYNPQVDSWTPDLVSVEARMKASCSTLLFVVDSQTRSISTMIEATEYICHGRRVVLVINYLAEGIEVRGQRLGAEDIKDLNRARSYLEDVAKRHRVPVCKTVQEAVQTIIEFRKQRQELGLNGIPGVGPNDDVAEPDQAELARAVDEINDEIGECQKKLTELNQRIEKREMNRQEVQEVQRTKQQQLRDLRAKTHALLDERNQIRAQINDAALREIPFVKSGEPPGSSGVDVQALVEQVKAKEKLLNDAKTLEDKKREELEQLRKQYGDACSEVASLLSERRKLRESINEQYSRLRALREDFHARREAWFHRQRELRAKAREERERHEAATQRPDGSSPSARASDARQAGQSGAPGTQLPPTPPSSGSLAVQKRLADNSSQQQQQQSQRRLQSEISASEESGDEAAAPAGGRAPVAKVPIAMSGAHSLGVDVSEDAGSSDEELPVEEYGTRAAAGRMPPVRPAPGSHANQPQRSQGRPMTDEEDDEFEFPSAAAKPAPVNAMQSRGAIPKSGNASMQAQLKSGAYTQNLVGDGGSDSDEAETEFRNLNMSSGGMFGGSQGKVGVVGKSSHVSGGFGQRVAGFGAPSVSGLHRDEEEDDDE